MAVGEARYSGNWGELVELVPRVNTMPSPYAISNAQISPPPSAIAGFGRGFVFPAQTRTNFAGSIQMLPARWAVYGLTVNAQTDFAVRECEETTMISWL